MTLPGNQAGSQKGKLYIFFMPLGAHGKMAKDIFVKNAIEHRDERQ